MQNTTIKNINKRIFGSQYQTNYIDDNQVYNWFSKTADQFKEVATEFTMQGLEIDWPIVTLTGDYYIKKDQNNNYR